MKTAPMAQSKKRSGRRMVVPLALLSLWLAGAAVLVMPDVWPFLRGPDFESESYAIYVDDEGPLARGAVYFVNFECDARHRSGRFYLHIYPVDRNDLEPLFFERGFRNIDFTFAELGWNEFGVCWIKVDLPSYSVTTYEFGQYVPDASTGRLNYLWTGEH